MPAASPGIAMNHMSRSSSDVTPFVLLICVIASMGGLMFGYAIGMSGKLRVLSSFLKRFFPDVLQEMQEDMQNSPSSSPPDSNQYCVHSSEKLTAFTSSLFMASMVASILASKVTREFGRRVSMILGGVLSLSGAILGACANTIGVLVLGWILLGFGIGFTNQSVPIYLSEMAPHKHRGALNIGFQLSITVGILLGSLLSHLFSAKIKGDMEWRLSLGGAMFPSLVTIIGCFFIPETPISLIQRGRAPEAKRELERIRRPETVDEEFRRLVAAGEAAERVRQPWKDLFLQRKFRPHITMAIMIPFFQQLTGISAMVFYSSLLFGMIGFKEDSALISAVITGSVNAFATLVSIYGVDRWGRRPLLLKGGAQMLVCQVIITVAIGLVELHSVAKLHLMLIKWYAIVVVLFICIYVAGFAWSWGPLGWLVPSEIFPLEVRSAAQSISVSANFVFTLAVAQAFPAMLCHLKFGLFIFFGAFVLIMSGFVYYFLLETKGIQIDEMDRVWKSHWYWSRFLGPEEFLTGGRDMARMPRL